MYLLVFFECDGGVTVVERKQIVGDTLEVGRKVMVKYGAKKYQGVVKAQGM